jgi:hypothetical protein
MMNIKHGTRNIERSTLNIEIMSPTPRWNRVQATRKDAAIKRPSARWKLQCSMFNVGRSMFLLLLLAAPFAPAAVI